MENWEIFIMLIPALIGVLGGIHLLFLLDAIKSNSSDSKMATELLKKMMRPHSASTIRMELKVVCADGKLVDSFFKWRRIYAFIAISAVVTLVLLNN